MASRKKGRHGRARAPSKGRSAPPAAPQRPAPQILTQAGYARHRKVSREAVRKAVADGRIPVREDRRIDVAVADAAWSANTLGGRGMVPTLAVGAESSMSEGVPEGVTHNDARALREWNQALLLQLQRRVRAGELVEASKVEEAGFQAAHSARDSIMTLPDRLSDELAAISDPEEIHRRLFLELHAVCEDLANTFAKGITPSTDEISIEENAS